MPCSAAFARWSTGADAVPTASDLLLIFSGGAGPTSPAGRVHAAECGVVVAPDGVAARVADHNCSLGRRRAWRRLGVPTPASRSSPAGEAAEPVRRQAVPV